jgi:riboflavin synthase alpha subunit
MTNLSSRHPGHRVNIECDIIAKHIEKLVSVLDLQGKAAPRPASRVTLERLRDEGF